MINNINFFEELTMNAHPALRTQMYDGWVLRFANGYTYRANSINPLYLSTIPIEEKITFCEEVYTTEGLPSVFKLTQASTKNLDRLLEIKDYEKVTPTNIMYKLLTDTDTQESKAIINQEINTVWQDNYFRLNGIADNDKMQTATLIHNNIKNKVLCGMLEENGAIVACGLCVIERSYAGLYGIIVDSSYRNKDYGYTICSSLLNAAIKFGAKVAYLQVVAENIPAVSLYQKLGFEHYYQYWYRVKKL